MNQVQELLDNYKRIRERLRNPPNAVRDTGINLRNTFQPEPPPEEPTPPLPHPAKTESSPSKSILPGVTFSSTLQITAEEFGITEQQIRSKSRLKNLAFPRQVAIYIAVERHRRGLSWVGKYLGRDHTTVIYARNKVTDMIAADPCLKERIDNIEQRIAIHSAASVPAFSQSHLEKGQEGDVSRPPIPQVD